MLEAESPLPPAEKEQALIAASRYQESPQGKRHLPAFSSLGGMAGGYISPYAISVLALCAEGAQAPICPSDRVVAAAFLAWSEIHPLPSDTPGGRVGLCRGRRPSFRGRCAGGWGDVTHYLAG